MNAPEYFEVHDSHGSYRPCKKLSVQEAVDLAVTSISFARQHNIRRLFIDSTQLTGFDSPGTWERFLLGVRSAQAGKAVVKVAMLARPEMIDPQHFGMTVARNRGLLCDVFTSEPDAIAWLLDKNIS